MPGTINNVVTVNTTELLSVEADDDASATFFGHAGQTNGEIAFLSDLVGQVVTVIMAVKTSGAATAGTITGQLYTTDPQQAGTTLVGPTFVLPSRLGDVAKSFLLVVTFTPGQTVGGLGITAADVGGDGDTTYNFAGVTVIVSD